MLLSSQKQELAPGQPTPIPELADDIYCLLSLAYIRITSYCCVLWIADFLMYMIGRAKVIHMRKEEDLCGRNLQQTSFINSSHKLCLLDLHLGPNLRKTAGTTFSANDVGARRFPIILCLYSSVICYMIKEFPNIYIKK